MRVQNVTVCVWLCKTLRVCWRSLGSGLRTSKPNDIVLQDHPEFFESSHPSICKMMYKLDQYMQENYLKTSGVLYTSRNKRPVK